MILTSKGNQGRACKIRNSPDHFLLHTDWSPGQSSAILRLSKALKSFSLTQLLKWKYGVCLSLSRAFFPWAGRKGYDVAHSHLMCICDFAFFSHWSYGWARTSAHEVPCHWATPALWFALKEAVLFSLKLFVLKSNQMSFSTWKSISYMLWVYMRNDYQR